jgi:NAD(P)H-dependent FMN reductase
MAQPTLQIIVASTRPGRIGLPIGRWVADAAAAHGGFDVELVDLAEVGLPLFDEPHHPRLGDYAHGHTKAWSATVRRADAFVFVTPEYNHSFNAALKNAIDYLFHEWAHKPVGFVSYGGVAGGTRAVQMLKPVVAALKMMPLVEGVQLPFVHRSIGEDGTFEPAEPVGAAATAMLDELARSVGVLRSSRDERLSA